MKVLVVGGGGREHALVWKIAQSPLAPQIYAAPGNAGISELAQCLPIPAADVDGLLTFARQKRIDLTVVGPELALEKGIVDKFREAKLTIFGPSREAALLETSKVFAKDFMIRQQIPTADYSVFSSSNEACRYVQRHGAPVVVKADGLAAGKGSVVAETVADAQTAIRQIMEERTFGSAGERVVVEEFMEGEEASILALVDGENYLTMISSQDHKRIYEADRGLNTGGMGAYAPAPVITEDVMAEVENHILRPAVCGMVREGYPFQGVLYAGLMMTKAGPRVVEFNCRFGDPETQVILPLLEDDFLELLLAVCDGTLPGRQVRWSSAAAVCVVMASAGYPGQYQQGFAIQGLGGPFPQDVMVFHAGTRIQDAQILTDGGRVLGVTAMGANVQEAVSRVYRAVEKISFPGAYFRGDIAHRALAREERFSADCVARGAGQDPRPGGRGGDSSHCSP